MMIINILNNHMFILSLIALFILFNIIMFLVAKICVRHEHIDDETDDMEFEGEQLRNKKFD